ncbi:UvrB/UvrC motif-containing protein [Sulfobacillus harzensis]|uniref:Excinuclease ABC subunit B n=1 Tax=Sulfobacillus harzensis TaxID=2729629 RepID=A0A7Y0L307_9FIRM|nr:UvrB/UvrC motif-containing protein [Sulfobacillus harzensis]NMP22153.1 excinuclease ABC subunit B [Sulfobacillus harzensis]
MGEELMMCQRCHEKPAQVHFSKVVNGEKSDRFLCEDCAREEGAFHFMLGPQFTVQQVLGSLIGQAGVPANRTVPEGRSCPHCGYTYRQFAESGRLGCDRCYEAFKEELGPLVLRLHGRAEHRGKLPRRGAKHLAAVRELERLRQKMADAIQREAFEEAAEIRDQIRRLTGGEAQ